MIKNRHKKLHRVQIQRAFDSIACNAYFELFGLLQVTWCLSVARLHKKKFLVDPWYKAFGIYRQREIRALITAGVTDCYTKLMTFQYVAADPAS